MILSLRKWVVRIKFIVIFALLSLLVFQLLQLLSVWLEPAGRYKEPEGKAVKVFHPEAGGAEAETALERLKIFYWYGE